MTYHQGVTWPWLTGLYVESFKKIIDAEKDKKEKDILKEKYNKYINSMKKVYRKVLFESGAIGNISEIYDSKLPYNPGGTVAQAWSVSEVMKLELENEK